MSYNVVFRNISDTISEGVITWTGYNSEEEFKESLQHPNMKKWYEVVAEGVTQEEAIEMCSSTANMAAIQLSQLREVGSSLRRAADIFEDVTSEVARS